MNCSRTALSSNDRSSECRRHARCHEVLKPEVPIKYLQDRAPRAKDGCAKALEMLRNAQADQDPASLKGSVTKASLRDNFGKIIKPWVLVLKGSAASGSHLLKAGFQGSYDHNRHSQGRFRRI